VQSGLWRRWSSIPTTTLPRPPDPPPGGAATPKIKARLFYLTADGMRLQPAERRWPCCSPLEAFVAIALDELTRRYQDLVKRSADLRSYL